MDQVRPYYDVKCNSSAVVVEILAALGTGFVCSSKVNFKSAVSPLGHRSLKVNELNELKD